MLEPINLLYGLFGMGLALGIFTMIAGPELERRHKPESFYE